MIKSDQSFRGKFNLNETVLNVMSFNQSDLYKVEQPGMLLKSDTYDQIRSNQIKHFVANLIKMKLFQMLCL